MAQSLPTDTTYTLIWQRAAHIEESPNEMRARPHAERYECNSTERKLYKQAQQRIQRQCGWQTAATCRLIKQKLFNFVIPGPDVTDEVWHKTEKLVSKELKG